VLFVGEGIERISLTKKSILLGVETEFAGFLDSPWRNFQPSDLLVVPSLYEGDGLVALEAISRGVPLMIKKIPAFERFGLPPQNYFISVADFVEKFRQHHNSPNAFTIPLEIRSKILCNRDIQMVGAAWVELLKRI
jgi:glycosyltransferase involved in cell wall biosynthesis